MSTPNIDKLFGASQGSQTPNIDQLFLQRRQETEPEGPGFGDWLGALREALPDLYGMLSGRDVAAQSAIGAGMVNKGLIEPAAAITGLPTAFLGYRTNKAAEFLNRASQGLYDRTEEAAKKSGMLDSEIQAAYDVGGFLGISLPIVASVKAGQLLMGGTAAFKASMAAYPTAGPLTTDIVAGAIYGGAFHQGGADERLKAMMKESAMWGAFRLIVTGLVPPFVAWRQKRAYEVDTSGRLQQLLTELENGTRPAAAPISREEMPAVLQLLQDENYLLQSHAAQELLRANAQDVALVQAIVDLGASRGTGSVFRSAGSTFEEAGVRVERFQQQFPGLKFSIVKRPLPPRPSTALHGLPGPAEGLPQATYDVYFGTRGLSSKQLAQLKLEGRFEGQILQFGDSEVTYVGRGQGKKRADRVRISYLDAEGNRKIKHVKESSVTDTPFIREEVMRTPEYDALFQDYFRWANERGRQVAAQRGSINEADLVAAVRDGQVTLGDDARRAFGVGGAIAHPEEIGLAGEAGINAVALRSTQQAQQAGVVAQGSVTRSPQGWQLAIQAEGEQLPQTAVFSSLDEAIAVAQQAGLGVGQVVRKYPTGAEITAGIAQGATNRVALLEPPQVLGFDDLFDLWAAERGLPRGATDYAAARGYFRDRMRRWAWQQVPADERKVFDAIMAEQERLIGEGDLPLEVLAHSKGFFIQREANGRIVGRHIETGMPLTFGGERTAREGLARIVRPEVDMPSILPMGPSGLQSFTGGLPAQDLFHFPDDIQSLHTLQDLRWQKNKSFVRNLRDIFQTIENQSGFPIYTEGLDKLLQAREQFLAAYEPIAKEIVTSWKGVSKKRQDAVMDFWIEAQARKLPFNEAVKAMVATGEFSAREVQSFRRSRAIFDHLFADSGISPERYVESYFSIVKPFFERTGSRDIASAFANHSVTPQEFEFWAEMVRTGELTTFERNPQMVLHKYARAVYWKKFMKQPWDQMAVLTGTRNSPPIRIRDLPVSQQQRIMAQAHPETTLESPVIPTPLRDMISEFLVNIRGSRGAAEQTALDFSDALLKRLGVNADPGILKDIGNSYMSTLYGSALGARPMSIARNMTQTIWNLYTRQGAKHIQGGMETALTERGFREALEEGAFHMSEAGIPMGDLIAQNLLDRGVVGTEGPLSDAIAATFRGSMRLGQAFRTGSRKLLTFYSSSDQISRGWSYWSTKLHADEWLTKFESGSISWEKFAEEGLAFFDPVVQGKFRQTYDFLGRERALRYIGRIGSEEANFIYISAVQPGFMQKPFMRFFGMFGTYPLWQAELYLNRMRNGTPAQIAKFAARNMILAGAIGNIAYQTGTNMWSWIAPASVLGWHGGPGVQYAVDLYNVADAPMDQKANAMGRMMETVGRLSFPGQGFIRDLESASVATDPGQALANIMLGRNQKNTNWAMDFMYDPMAPPHEDFLTPETRQELSAPFPMPKNGVLLEFGGPEARWPALDRAAQKNEEVRTRQPAPLNLLEGNIR